MIQEITVECPKCEEQCHKEFNLHIADKRIGGIYFCSKKEKVRCNNCGFDFDCMAHGEIEVETT